jgi:hypothetical protein
MLKGEYCRTLTRDGLELQGFLAIPEAGPAKTSVLHVHGLAGNFYENRFIDHVAASVVRLGVNFLTINTRGRDYISDFFWERPDGTTQYKQIGGIYEISKPGPGSLQSGRPSISSFRVTATGPSRSRITCSGQRTRRCAASSCYPPRMTSGASA